MSDFHKRKAEKKSQKVYTLTQGQIDQIKRDAVDYAVQQAFIYMLSVPCEILANDYWPKTAKQRIPKFIDDCLELYGSFEQGVVTLDQMVEDLEKLSGIKLKEYSKARRFEFPVK